MKGDERKIHLTEQVTLPRAAVVPVQRVHRAMPMVPVYALERMEHPATEIVARQDAALGRKISRQSILFRFGKRGLAKDPFLARLSRLN